jgi:hypothetical protein
VAGDMKKSKLIFWLINAGWCLLNIIQAAFTELANDEAYYYAFSKHLDFGYFDHPPMIALYIFLGSFLSGELGVRLLAVLSQPLFLYFLWKIIAPPNTSVKSVLLFFLIAFSAPMLHIYGFVAVPDAPLLLFSALFLYSFINYLKFDKWKDIILMGIAIAAIGYSKYTGVLVVFFAVMAVPKIFLKKGIYISGVIAFVLMLPHFYWQYLHDWSSFYYHLVGRNEGFKLAHIGEYLLNFLLVFNPLLFPVFVWKSIKFKQKPIEYRVLFVMAAGFFFFYLFSCFKGHIQPQWFIPVLYAVIAFLWYAMVVEPIKRLNLYLKYVCFISVFFSILFRIELFFNPLQIDAEVFNNRKKYETLSNSAGELPLIFKGKYAHAAKYNFYTGKPAFAYPDLRHRTSQYQFWNMDDAWIGKPVAILNKFYNVKEPPYVVYNVKVDSFYTPVRKLEAILHNSIPKTIHNQDSIMLDLTLKNPYPYSVFINGETITIHLALRQTGVGAPFRLFPAKAILEIPPHEEKRMQILFKIDDLKEEDAQKGEAGIVIAHTAYHFWYNSKIYAIKVMP